MDYPALLGSWLESLFKGTPYICTPLAGDASFRRYWRVRIGAETFVVMEAPPPETTVPFIEIAGLLAKAGLSVPRVLEQNTTLGFLLLSDLGDNVYLPALKFNREHNAIAIEHLYQNALTALVKIHSCKPLGLSFSFNTFDIPFMVEQLALFETWYLKKHLGLGPEIQLDRSPLEVVLQKIIQLIDKQPKVFIHRDYHSRNLMVLETDNPGILDFQDAMMGPITYDLVSLFQDCYIQWPREKVLQWVLSFKAQLIQATLLSPMISDTQFIQWFDWTGLQRHLKNLGIFSRLHHRDGKSGYLGDIPLLLDYIKTTCDLYAELKPLADFFIVISEQSKICAL